MSPALGSSMLASCWVARNILRSAVSASSSARTLDSRPTTNGVIMYGKITMSRMGIMGSLRGSFLSREVVIVPPLLRQAQIGVRGRQDGSYGHCIAERDLRLDFVLVIKAQPET